MRTDYYCSMAPFCDFPADCPFFPAVEGTERFIEDKEVSITGQDTPEVQAFQLTAGENSYVLLTAAGKPGRSKYYIRVEAPGTHLFI